MEMDQQAKQLQEAESALRDSINAEKFFETNVGLLFTRYAEIFIQSCLKDILSNKYDKDHQGFLARKAEMSAYQKMLRKMQATASPVYRNKVNTAIKQMEENG